MKFTYPAKFSPSPKGGYDVSFPDLPGFQAYGADLEDALDAAIDALRAFVEAEFAEDEPDFPAVSDHAVDTLAEGEFFRDIGVIHHIQEGWSD